MRRMMVIVWTHESAQPWIMVLPIGSEHSMSMATMAIATGGGVLFPLLLFPLLFPLPPFDEDAGDGFAIASSECSTTLRNSRARTLRYRSVSVVWTLLYTQLSGSMVSISSSGSSCDVGWSSRFQCSKARSSWMILLKSSSERSVCEDMTLWLNRLRMMSPWIQYSLL